MSSPPLHFDQVFDVRDLLYGRYPDLTILAGDAPDLWQTLVRIAQGCPAGGLLIRIIAIYPIGLRNQVQLGLTVPAAWKTLTRLDEVH